MLFTIRHYTRESGVRSLERVLAKVCRKVARDVVRSGKDFRKVLDEASIVEYLGAKKYKYGKKELKNEVGLANGLAWTEVGGDILQVEASLIKGKGTLMLTGQLGDVMQESARAGLYLRQGQPQFFNIRKKRSSATTFTIHAPRGHSQGRSFGGYHHGGGDGVAAGRYPGAL